MTKTVRGMPPRSRSVSDIPAKPAPSTSAPAANAEESFLDALPSIATMGACRAAALREAFRIEAAVRTTPAAEQHTSPDPADLMGLADALAEVVVRLPANTLADAAYQLDAAYMFAHEAAMGEDDAPQLRLAMERVERVLLSIMPALIGAAGLDPVDFEDSLQIRGQRFAWVGQA